MWDKDDGVKELEKLLKDYKIIKISNTIISKAASFGNCISNWNDYVQYIKVPADILVKKLPYISNFISCLKDITTRRELSYEKREGFLKELEEKYDTISSLKEKALEVFKDEYSAYLIGFDDNDITKLICQLSSNSFRLQDSQYRNTLDTKVTEFRKEQAHYELRSLWEQLSESGTPITWSDKKRTPIKVMVSPDEMDNASKLFNIIIYGSPDRNDIEETLEFLKSKPRFLNGLNDHDKIEAAFRRELLRSYAPVLLDNDKVRDYLETIDKRHFKWYGDFNIQNGIEKLAKKSYSENNKKVMEMIDSMSADEAKEYLKELVADNLSVGIAIINKGDV